MRATRARHGAGVLGLLGLIGWVAVAGLGAGCSPKGVLTPNAEPQTSLFVEFDPADTLDHAVNHEVRLFWYGTDVDGEVVAYEFRFLEPGGPADPPWSRTTNTDSLFTIQVPTGTLMPTFEVRAIDDQGAVDPTPAAQELSLTNEAPTLTLIDPPGAADSTFATQTIGWIGIDPDGDADRIVYRVWLDGHEADAHVMTVTSFTFPTSDFLQSGQLQSGPRTAFVQAFDAGGRASVVRSATWYVRAPAAAPAGMRLLLIDNVPTTNPANGAIDNVYNQTLIRNGIVANTTVLRLQTGRPFRTTLDLYQSLKLFDAVVWYRGTEPYLSGRDTLLVRHQDAMRAYVEEGGRFLFESLDMVQGEVASGILSQEFLVNVLQCDSLLRYKPSDAENLTEDWGLFFGSVLQSSLFADSLRSSINPGGLRGFALADTHDVVLWGRAGSLDPAVPYDVPVAVRAHPGAGKMVAVSLPLAPPLNGFGSLTRFLDKIFAELGVTGTAPSFARPTSRSTALNRRHSASFRRR